MATTAEATATRAVERRGLAGEARTACDPVLIFGYNEIRRDLDKDFDRAAFTVAVDDIRTLIRRTGAGLRWKGTRSESEVAGKRREDGNRAMCVKDTSAQNSRHSPGFEDSPRPGQGVSLQLVRLR